MDLVDGYGCIFRLTGGSRIHPVAVRPWEGLRSGDDGCAAWSSLACARNRIGFLREELAVRPDQLIFVTLAGPQPRNEQLPNPSLPAQAHGVTSAVPAVEIANHGDTPGIRRPDGKADAGYTIDRHGLGTKHITELVMRALSDQVQIKVAEEQAEAVGILRFLNGVGPVDPQSIRNRSIEPADEQPGRMNALKTRERMSCLPRQNLDQQGPRHEDANDASSIHRVFTQDLERISMSAIDQGLDAGGLNV